MMSKEEIKKKIEALEMIIKFHTEYGVIKSPKELERHVDDALEELSELYKKLKELE